MHFLVEARIVLFGIDSTDTAQSEVLSSLATHSGDRVIEHFSCDIKSNIATGNEQELHKLAIRTLDQCRVDHRNSVSRAA